MADVWTGNKPTLQNRWLYLWRTTEAKHLDWKFLDSFMGFLLTPDS